MIVFQFLAGSVTLCVGCYLLAGLIWDSILD